MYIHTRLSYCAYYVRPLIYEIGRLELAAQLCWSYAAHTSTSDV